MAQQGTLSAFPDDDPVHDRQIYAIGCSSGKIGGKIKKRAKPAFLFDVIKEYFFRIFFYNYFLNNTLVEHGVGHFQESGHVGTLNIVDISILVFAVFHTSAMDIFHDLVQALVNFF